MILPRDGRPEDSYVPRVVVDEALIRQIADKIVEHFKPYKIILFGSYARGTANKHSDVDLLVVMDSDEPAILRSIPILKTCRPKYVALEVIVRTPEEVRYRLEGTFDPFFREIFREGKVLYDKPAS